MESDLARALTHTLTSSPPKWWTVSGLRQSSLPGRGRYPLLHAPKCRHSLPKAVASLLSEALECRGVLLTGYVLGKAAKV